MTPNDEIEILFGSICDGLRQEVRYRHIFQIGNPNDDFRLTEERERGLVGTLAFQIRNSGFLAQTESYFYDDDNLSSAYTPDLAIRLPNTGKYLFLEVKPAPPGFSLSLCDDDMQKLMKPSNPKNKRNGFLAIGFAQKSTNDDIYKRKFNELSLYITSNYSFKLHNIKCVDLEAVGDENLKYALVGLWLRKLR